MHLAGNGCRSGFGGRVVVVAGKLLVGVDRGCAGGGGLLGPHARRRGSWVGGREARRRRGQRRRGAGSAGLEVGRGRAGELTASFSQQREAGQRQAAGVGSGAGSRVLGGEGRRASSVGRGGGDKDGAVVVVVLGWGGGGGRRGSVDKDGAGGRGRKNRHGQRNEGSSPGHRR